MHTYPAMSFESLKSLLVRRDVVAAEQIERAVALERAGEGTWLERLLLEHVLDEERLADCVARESRVPRCAPKLLDHIPPNVIEHVPPEIAVEHCLVPVLVDTDGYLHLAMINPGDEAAVEEARFFAGARVMRVVAAASAIARALHQYYGFRSRLCARGTGPIPTAR